jgi:hypothetical protein
MNNEIPFKKECTILETKLNMKINNTDNIIIEFFEI